MFWDVGGSPISVGHFSNNVLGALPEFFKNEDEWREICSAPLNRKAFLSGLEVKGCSKEIFLVIQKIIDAEKSD